MNRALEHMVDDYMSIGYSRLEARSYLLDAGYVEEEINDALMGLSWGSLVDGANAGAAATLMVTLLTIIPTLVILFLGLIFGGMSIWQGSSLWSAGTGLLFASFVSAMGIFAFIVQLAFEVLYGAIRGGICTLFWDRVPGRGAFQKLLFIKVLIYLLRTIVLQLSLLLWLSELSELLSSLLSFNGVIYALVLSFLFCINVALAVLEVHLYDRFLKRPFW